MDTKELLKKVRKIEIKTRRLSNHIFGGEYHSTFKGRGMTFSEVRQYQFGDDVRTIDWNVTARYQEPFVKVFEEERELTMMLMVDISGSGFFGTKERFKKDMLIEIAATLAFSSTKNNDKVGLLLYSDKVEKFIPPKKGSPHVLRMIRELIDYQPDNNGSDLDVSLKYVRNMMRKRAIIFILSDFMDDDYEQNLKVLGNRHDVTGIRVFDRHEESMPKMGMVQFKDAETGQSRVVDTNSKKVRQEYANYFQGRRAYFQNSFRKSGAGSLSIRADENYVKKLLGYFKTR